MTAGSGDNSDVQPGGPDEEKAQGTPETKRAAIRKLAKTIIDQKIDPNKVIAEQPPVNLSANAKEAQTSSPQTPQYPAGQAEPASAKPQRLPGGGYQVPRKKSQSDTSGTHPTYKAAEGEDPFTGGVPASQPGMPSNSTQGLAPAQQPHPGMPSNSMQGLPPVQQPHPGMPSNSMQGLAPAQQPHPGMPSNSMQGLPPVQQPHPGMPSNSMQGLPPLQQPHPGMPSNSMQGLPPVQQPQLGMPSNSMQGLPPVQQPQPGINANSMQGLPPVQPVPAPARATASKRKGITKTAIDMIISFGNRLTGNPNLDESSAPAKPNPFNDQSRSQPYYDESPAYVNPDYENQSDYQQFETSETGESIDSAPHERVPRTLLDISVLNDITATTGAKKVLKAAEEARERANEPIKPFIAIETNKRALPCAWKWEGEESRDRFRYCDLCSAQVYNFAGMELPQAEALIFSRENRSEAPLYKRTDGKYMTSNCPLAMKKRNQIILLAFAGIFLVVSLLAVMMIMPKPSKPVEANSKTDGTTAGVVSGSTSASSSSGYSAKTGSGVGNGPTQASSGSTSLTTGSQSSGTTSTGTTGGSNGGYGPSDSQPSNWQWQYDNAPARSNTNSAPATQATPVAPAVTPSQQAELTRLKQGLINQNSQESKPDQ